MFSNNREYIDSIDVEDLPADYQCTISSTSRPRSQSRPLSISSTSSASVPSLMSLTSLSSSSQLAASPPSASNAMPCTLILFDDKLMIVKRQSGTISGRSITGLDDVPGLVKNGGGIAVIEKNPSKKDKLTFRGSVDILDIIASDVGNGGDFAVLFLLSG